MTETDVQTLKSYTLELTPSVPNKAVQRIGIEGSATLHERLRPDAIGGFVYYPKNITLKITTPSWYTFDASEVLGIPGAVAVSAATCKHHVPFVLFLGRRTEGWQREAPEHKNWIYTLGPLGRQLTLDEKNRIYDEM